MTGFDLIEKVLNTLLNRKMTKKLNNYLKSLQKGEDVLNVSIKLNIDVFFIKDEKLLQRHNKISVMVKNLIKQDLIVNQCKMKNI